MSHTAAILEDAWRAMSGVVGQMALCITTRRGLSVGLVTEWQRKLRDAADRLEGLK